DDEAYVARQAVRDAGAKADTAQQTATTAAEAASPPGTRRVTYVPEIVKKQMRDEIRQEVMARAEKEHWAAPGALPEWTQRI
ncbi:putative porin, partial [Acinetobacter baumannii]